jgi:tetratricopeptide (TPR) repeat protein
LACAARAAGYWQDSSPRKKAIAIRLRGSGHEINKEYTDAIAAYREALDIYRSISPESSDVVIALNALSNAEASNKDYAAAERDYREALRIANKIEYWEGIASITGNMAEIALYQEHWLEAETTARQAIVLSEKVGRQELIAHDCNSLARALLKQSKNLEEALTFAVRAVNIYTQLRMLKESQEAQQTQAEIEKAMRGE